MKPYKNNMPIKNILIVDDSKSARLMLRKMLQDANLNVDMAESAEQALDYLNSKHPDAIFMDHTMPGMDGLQAVKAIKKNPNTATIPIVMYTSKEEENYLAQVKANGGMGILSKPATQNDLSKILHELEDFSPNGKEKPENIPVGKSAPPAAPLRVKGSIEVIEDIATVTAESVVNDMLQSQIIPHIEERISKLKEDIRAGSIAAFTDVADKICEERIQILSKTLFEQISSEIKTQLPPLQQTLQKELVAVFEERLQDIENKKAYQNLIKSLSQLNERVNTLATHAQPPNRLDPKTIEQIRNIAKSTAAQLAHESAQQIAKRTTQDNADKISQDLNILEKSLNIRMYLLFSLTLIVGLSVIYVLYYLR